MKRLLYRLGFHLSFCVAAIVASFSAAIIPTTNVGAANFPTYTYKSNGSFIVSGGALSEFLTSSSFEATLKGGFWTATVNVKPDHGCDNNRATIRIVANDVDSAAESVVTNVLAYCENGNDIVGRSNNNNYSVEDKYWTDGKEPVIKESPSPGQPNPSRPPGVGQAETYRFLYEKDVKGKYLIACSGMFKQFSEVGAPGTELESCIEFIEDSSSPDNPLLTWTERVTVSNPSLYGCSGTGKKEYRFTIAVPNPPTLNATGGVPGKLTVEQLTTGNCDGLELKGAFDGMSIEIMEGDRLESLIGIPFEAATGDSLCQVEGGLGWFLCPLLNTMASITDKAWETVVGTFLEIPPISTDTDSSNSLYQAWAVMRNIANVLFVIAFLLIIYSQLTSMGVSNYGIKKMLPRLIMGAILVNASFWLAAVAVDVSNIVGASIYNVLGSVTQATVSEVTEEPPEWSVVTSRILAAGIVGGAAYMAGFAVLVPLLLSSAFFIIGLVVTLAFRHAVLLILIVAAPFAAIAYMLPNTDKLSRSWWTLFKLLLIIYPLIAFVVGASILAGSVIFNAADNILMQLIGMAAPAMGILGIPFLVKATSGVLGKLGFSNPFSGIKNSAMERAKKAGSGITENNRNRRRARALDYANKNRGSTSRFRRASAWAAGVRGGGIAGRVKAKRELNKSNAETQQTIFEEDGGLGGKLKDIQSAMRQNRIVSSAAEGATKQQDLVEFANKTDSDLKRLAGGSPEMLTNLKQQRASAISQAASAVAIETSNLGVPQVATQLEAAIREGDRVRAEALTTKLTKMGGAGASKLREVYSNIDSEIADGRLDGSSETVAGAYKQMNSAVRSSGLKAKAADVYQHSIREGFIGSQETVMDRAKDKSTWATLSDAELAGQTTGKKGTEVIGGVEAAAENDALPDKERLLRVVGSDVARSAGNQEAIDLYSRIATSSGSTASANPTPPQATPAQSSTTSPPPSAASPQPSPVTPVTPTPGVVVTPSTSTGGVDSSQLNIPRGFGNADGSSDSNS